MNSRRVPDPTGDSPNDLVLDLDGALERIGGDKHLLRELASIFIEDAPPLLSRLTASLAERDCEKAQHYAHGLKGIAANVGGVRLEHLALRIENAARDRDLVSASDGIDRLSAELTRLIETLKSMLMN
jgi:HPt (histidine-containing phosphotransfer) domain-containing protein